MELQPKNLLDRGNATNLLRISTTLLFSLIFLGVTTPLPLKALTPEPDGGYPNANTAEGDFALFLINVNYATDNTALGYDALHDNTQGDYNTATGSGALRSNLANNNTATGDSALWYNTYGQSNTAIGYFALIGNKIGNENTAVGAEALHGNGTSSGSYNTASGARALFSNQDGGVNVANGYKALETNVGGFYNVALGGFALGNNTNGSYNVGTGANALYYNTGGGNTATGHQALQNNTTGSYNVALGYTAGNNLTTGSNNIIIGAGVLGTASDANVTRIGKSTQKKTFISGIYGKTVASGVGVIVNSSGQLGTVQSSVRYKDDIEPMDKASEALLKLRPVTFHYKKELDPDGVVQFGLIAEQVEKVNPDLVVRDEEGKVSTVRYEAVNAMLLNEFLKEHRKVEEQGSELITQDQNICRQDAMIEQLRALVAQQQKQIKTLTDGIQKINHKLEVGLSAPILAANQK